MASQLLRSASARSAGTVVRRLRPVASKAVVNSHSPAAKLASIENPVAFIPQSVAFPTPQGNVIRALTSLWRGRLAGKLERGGPVGARFPAFVTSYEGPRAGFLNFCRRFGSGKPSFLRIPFVDHCSEATNSITNWLIFSPVQLSPCALNHAHKKAWRRTHGVQRNSATGASNE